MTVTKRWPVNRESYSYSNLIAYLYICSSFFSRMALHLVFMTPYASTPKAPWFPAQLCQNVWQARHFSPPPIKILLALLLLWRGHFEQHYRLPRFKGHLEIAADLSNFLFANILELQACIFLLFNVLISVDSHNRSGNIVYHTVYQMNMELQNRWPIMLVNKLPMGHAGFGYFIKY